MVQLHLNKKSKGTLLKEKMQIQSLSMDDNAQIHIKNTIGD